MSTNKRLNLKKKEINNNINDITSIDSISTSSKSSSSSTKGGGDLLLYKNDKWRSWWIRSASTAVLLVTFISIIYLGHVAAACLLILSNCMVFKEINSLASRKQGKERLSSASLVINWYFFMTSMYFLIGRIFFGRFGPYFRDNFGEIVEGLLDYHHLISFLAYIIGFMAFVLTLEVGKYKAQFQRLAWTHMAMLSISVQTSFWINNILQGFIWFILPTGLVMINDTLAFVFGFFFGRTKLIEVSPRKTLEGFIGGMFSTLVGSYILATQLSKFHWMICPKVDFLLHPIQCIPSEIFSKSSTPIFKFLLPYFNYFGIESLPFPPIVLHGLSLGLFASLVAPYGGFFASGIKRAFNIKDFGSSIPGHGGVTDRTDCQFFMGTFTYIYIMTFVRRLPAVAAVLVRASSLTPSDQLDLYFKLQSMLIQNGLLSS